jgi:hypothetical protein|tara:strand:- start:1746 stop:1919 length:174 start_codon:yes stop_codon:yes gene_type:complete
MEIHKEILDKARENTDRVHETFLKTRAFGVEQIFLNMKNILNEAEKQNENWKPENKT